MAELHSNT